MSIVEELKALERQVRARADELRPALAEWEQLQHVAARLGIDLEKPTAPPSAARGTTKTSRSPGKKRPRRRSSASKPAARKAAARPSRPKKTGVRGAKQVAASGRRDQVRKLVVKNPGISVTEVGKRLNVDPTGLYRVVRDLQAGGQLTKKGRELHPPA